MTGGKHQPPLLGWRDAPGRPAEVASGATAHLDEDGRVAITANKVDLATLDAEVARQHAQAVRNEMLGRSRFAGIADRLGG